MQESRNFSELLLHHLHQMGVHHAFGVVGGAISRFYDALTTSEIHPYHCRHETGAAFCATESYFAAKQPALLFVTTGPGLLNGLTGVAAAKYDGAKLIVITGSTNSDIRGRNASQETSSYNYSADFENQNNLFDLSVRIDTPQELAQVLNRINIGFQKPDGFIAHLSLPLSIQKSLTSLPASFTLGQYYSCAPSAAALQESSQRLNQSSFVVAIGHGAKSAAKEVRALIEKTNAHAFATPRGKGILPESHPNYLGSTGVGGCDEVNVYMKENQPDVLLVLGSRMGESSTFWDNDLLPAKTIIQVDLDSTWIGCAQPGFHVIGIQSDIQTYLQALLPHINKVESTLPEEQWEKVEVQSPKTEDKVRASYLMGRIQEKIVESTDIVLMSEAGNAFAWCNHLLKFDNPEQYRVSPNYGSMGHFSAGAFGAAITLGRKVLTVVGDGSMLMNCEINTAVQYQAPVIWLVLNDAAYDTCEKGLKFLDAKHCELPIPNVNFAHVSQAMGATGLEIKRETDIDGILTEAIAVEGPVVIDVDIDNNEVSPLFKRFQSIAKQSRDANVAGWDK